MNFDFRFKASNNAKKLRDNIELQSNKVVREYLETVVEFLEEKMNEPKTGRQYTVKDPVSGQSFTYTASAPNEYPGIKFGRLVADIQVKTAPGSNQYITKFIIGTDQPHGQILEEKDPFKGGRPWLSRALKEHEDILKMKLQGLVGNNNASDS